MKSIATSIFFFLFGAYTAFALNLDSLGKAAIVHASHNNIRALRPVYKEMGKNMPHFIKLYCDIAIASSEGSHERVIECVDSLKQWYPKKLHAKTLLSLAEIKAESLRQMGDYKALESHCNKELKYFGRRNFKKSTLKELYYYQNKAKRLLGNGTRAEILQYADRLDVFKLDSILTLHLDKLDKYTQLRSKIVLAHCFHNMTGLSDCATQLVDEFADSLDAKELTYCIEAKADLLAQKGEWKALKQWINKTSSIDRGHSANLKYYTLLANAFSNNGAASVSIPRGETAVDITYEWPLLLKAYVNKTTSVHVALETEQARTLISEKVAEKCNAQILHDTITVVSSMGIMDACPTLIKELKIGDIKFNNSLVYTMLDKNEHAIPFEISLGTNEIMRLGKITFLPEKLLVHDVKSATDEGKRHTENLYMSEHNGLRMHAYYKGEKQPLGIDLGCPYNFLNQSCFKAKGNSTAPIDIETTTGYLHIASPNYIDEKIDRCNGILGTTFLRSYRNVTLDFVNMRLIAEEPTTYRPCRNKFGHSTDKFYLQRNRSALSINTIADEEECYFLDLLLSIGKNRPAKVVQISEQLREKESVFYDAYTEAEGLFDNGQYKAAIELLHNVMDNKQPFVQLSTSEQKILSNVLNNYKLFAECDSTVICGDTEYVRLQKSKEGTVEIKINGKKREAIADIFTQHTEVSSKYIKKLNIKILGIANGIKYGIIPHLEIGNINIKNAHCVIVDTDKAKRKLPNKGKGIIIGWDLIRHFKQFAFSNQHLLFSRIKVDTKKEGTPLYLLKEWLIETKTYDGYATYQLNTKENSSTYPQKIKVGNYSFEKSDFKKAQSQKPEYAEGKISINTLLQKAGTITFDLENMTLF